MGGGGEGCTRYSYLIEEDVAFASVGSMGGGERRGSSSLTPSCLLVVSWSVAGIFQDGIHES